MLNGLETDHALAIKEQAEANGIFLRFIHWSQGFQVGVFLMSPTGWGGRMSEWHQNEYNAWLEAETVLDKLIAEKKEKEKKDELRTTSSTEDRRGS